MKVGDIVVKRTGKIKPEENGVPGLLVSLDRHDTGWPTATVMYSFGFRTFLQHDLGIFYEDR